MGYYCFIQARYSSKRLRGKVLKKFGKKTLLEVMFERLEKSNQLQKIVVLTSRSKIDKKIVNICKKNKIDYFCGSLNNVFSRFKHAIKKFSPKKIVRISGDSPLIDWRLIDKMISLSKKKLSFDIYTNVKKRTFPKGQSVEIINPEIFNISDNSLSTTQKEHVTKFFYKKKKYKIINYSLKKKYNQYNLCIDSYNDYLNILDLVNKKGIFATWKKYVKKKS